MRILQETMSPDDPQFLTVIAAVDPEAPPEVGSLLPIGGVRFRVEAVYKWYEAFSGLLDYREQAVELLLRRDEPGEAGSAERLRPPAPNLSDGAEASPEADPGERSPPQD